MSHTDSSSDEDSQEPFNTKRLQSILVSLHDDLVDSIDKVRSLRKKSKAVRKSILVRELRKDMQEIFEMKEASPQDIINFWIPLWKDEGRVSRSGRYVRLGEEALVLGLEPEKKVDMYSLYDLLDCLFV
jgi:hypothetical protein